MAIILVLHCKFLNGRGLVIQLCSPWGPTQEWFIFQLEGLACVPGMEFTYNQSTHSYVRIFRFCSAAVRYIYAHTNTHIHICIWYSLCVRVCVYPLQQLFSVLLYCSNHFIVSLPKYLVASLMPAFTL